MLNGTKRRPDYQIRFQNSSFRKKLGLARNYKRRTAKLPETKTGEFLKAIGLGSWQSKFFTTLGLAVLVYLVYIPNPFFVKQINIIGLKPGDQEAAEQIARSFMTKMLPWPQRNLLLLSSKNLAAYLLNNDGKILSIDSVNKHFPSTLEIIVKPRTDSFLLKTSVGSYTVANDGLITQVVGDSLATSTPQLTVINLTDSQTQPVAGQSAFSKQQISAISMLAQKLPAITSQSLKEFDLAKLDSPDFKVVLASGLALKFSFSDDFNLTLNHLAQLLPQLGGAQQKNISYIDMRYQGRGYVCYKNNPCASQTLPASILQPSTSTSPSLSQ